MRIAGLYVGNEELRYNMRAAKLATAKTAWYAVRVTPGSQRMARALIGDDVPEHKIGETIVERECRQEGVPVFMPAVWLTILKHRSKKYARRRVPLFIGYAFVNIRPDDFEMVRRNVSSITAFLRANRFSSPAVFDENIISRLALDDFSRYQQSRYEMADKQSGLREQRMREIRSEQSRIRQRTLGQKGRRRNKNFSMDVEAFMDGLDEPTRTRWEVMSRELKALESWDIPLEAARKIA